MIFYVVLFHIFENMKTDKVIYCVKILILIFTYTLNAQENDLQMPRIINFSGMNWYVRSGNGNPGMNLWSDDEHSVWVDGENRLHLKIRKINGKWHSSEVVSVHPTTYGAHRFYLSGNIDKLDKNLVAAVFLYKEKNKEMDIEFSRWKQEKHPNVQYVVQPESAENLFRFEMNLSGNYSTHSIDWQANRIIFSGFSGHHIFVPNEKYLINQWKYDKKQLRDDGQYRIHINLWMVDNLSPSNQKEAELIISGVDTPISPIIMTGDTYEDINIYPNHYYDHVFVNSKYPIKECKLIDLSGNEIFCDYPENTYFFIDMIEKKVGKYRLILKTHHKTYRFDIQKRY